MCLQISVVEKTLMSKTHLNNILICRIFYSINKYRSPSYSIIRFFIKIHERTDE